MVGKRVSVKVPARDNFGRVVTESSRRRGFPVVNRYTSVTGKCTFIGMNKILGRLQVTIDRMPIEISSVDEVKILGL